MLETRLVLGAWLASPRRLITAIDVPDDEQRWPAGA